MPTDDLRATYRTTATVGVTLMATVVLYAVIAEIMHVYLRRFDGVATAFAPVGVRYVFCALAVVAFVAARLVRSRLARAGGSRASVAQRLQTASIASLASCETIAVFGFLLFILLGRRRDLYAFLLVSGVAFALNFPRWSEWQAHERRSRNRAPV